MSLKPKNEKEEYNFQQNKILSLNKFFMKNVKIGSLLLILIFILSFIFFCILINNDHIDEGLRISLISMLATFILTTSKSIIDKIIAIIKFLIALLSEEQRGLNKNIGIEMDKIEFDEDDSNADDPSS